MNSHAEKKWPSVALICLAGILAHSPLLFGGGWFSDDYMFVYGMNGQPLPGFEESVRSPGAGAYSVARTFSHALIGDGGWFVGELGAMLIRLSSHTLNAVLFFVLLCRLGFSNPPPLAAALIFVTVAWHTQAVVWWSVVHLGLAITFILLALLAYQSWLERGMVWRLLLQQALVFALLITYEQALAAWLVFFGVALLHAGQPAKVETGGLWGTATRALASAWPMLIPFALWTVIYLATFPLETGPRTPTAIERNLIALLSTHWRWLHSVAQLPWSELLRQGLSSLTPLAVLLCAAFAAVGTRLLGADGGTAGKEKNPVFSLPLALTFSYLLFAGFRLVFVMKGAVSTETRNNYGADMGVALAVAAVAYALFAVWLRKPYGYAVVITMFCLFNALAARGEAWHTARNVEDERRVFEQAVIALSANAAADSLAVVVRKPLTRGEREFYEEADGGWLQYRLKQALGRKIAIDIRHDGSPPMTDAVVVELK